MRGVPPPGRAAGLFCLALFLSLAAAALAVAEALGAAGALRRAGLWQCWLDNLREGGE